MISRSWFYLEAVAILISVRIYSSLAKRGGRPLLESANGLFVWSPYQLLVASFLTLFAELAFIRWIAVEIRVFAYFKNLALLLCFVGFGLGCALARQAVRWPVALKALMGLLLVVRLPWRSGKALEGLSQGLGAAADVELWTTGNVWNWLNFLAVVLLTAILFLLLVWIFVPLGQIVGRQMNLAPKALTSYSWNLLGSLLGILTFLAVSRMMLPPWVWLGIVLAGAAMLQATAKDRLLLLSLVIPLVLLLLDPSSRDHYAIWTPYQQIEYTRSYAANGDFARGELKVNHTGYQAIVNLSAEFLARHPKLLKEPQDENPYDVPFRFSSASPSVLIVGSGTGDDVAAALRHGSSSVDAVEIDPAILAIGKREHPEHPYDSPLVSIYRTDARAFLKRTSRRYDLVLFGLLDSHTQFSDYSNMRIDNFVYTMESFREAREHLNPNGVVFLKFAVDRPWMGRRLAEMLQQTFGRPPLVFYAGSSYTPAAVCFAVSPSDRIDDALSHDASLTEFVSRNHFATDLSEVPVTTDDWPYLYQQDRRIPRTYLSLGTLVLLVTLGLYSRIPEARRQVPSLFFFSMGAGFMLLETQVISRLALYFGTTWQVNGIVISVLLTALLLANQVVDYFPKSLSRIWIVLPLLAGLIVAYCLPFTRIPGPPAFVGALVAVVFAVPVIFAGLLFSLEFRAQVSPGAALGANVLGAVVGGLLENFSLLLGMRALLPITIAIYCIAAYALRQRQDGNLLRPVAASDLS
jgi:SAM-dependent methyltransferase